MHLLLFPYPVKLLGLQLRLKAVPRLEGELGEKEFVGWFPMVVPTDKGYSIS